jgi:hypothetical protein
MISELDRVVLTVDLPEHGLQAGDVGVVMLVIGEHSGYSVEFLTLQGETVAVIAVYADPVRPIEADEMIHVRKRVSA